MGRGMFTEASGVSGLAMAKLGGDQLPCKGKSRDLTLPLSYSTSLCGGLLWVYWTYLADSLLL